MNTIHAFFDKSFSNGEPEILIPLFRDSWRAMGWDVVLLRPGACPLAKRISAHVSSLPTVNSRAYEDACFSRWAYFRDVAVKEGSVCFCDWDVINYGLPAGLHRRRPALSSGRREGAMVGGLLWLNLEQVDACVEKIFSLGKSDCVTIAGKAHISDMYALQDFILSFPTQCLGILSDFGDPDWGTSQLVHFSNASVGSRGLTRFQAIAQRPWVV